MAPNGNAHHLGLIDHRLDLLGTIMLIAAGVPSPDTAAGSPDFNGIGILAQTLTHRTAQLPRTVDLVTPRMRLLVLELAAAMRVAMPGSAAKPETRRVDARPLEHPVVDAVAHMDAKPPDLAHSGETMG